MPLHSHFRLVCFAYGHFITISFKMKQSFCGVRTVLLPADGFHGMNEKYEQQL
jgi:hypothetical protein